MALASSPHRFETVACRPWLNMSPTMVIPPAIHWPEPPSSGTLNCAMLPPPLATARAMCSTAASDRP